MPLFKRKPDTLIPPVAPASSLPSATRSRPSPNTYPNTYPNTTASREDGPNYGTDIEPYNRNKGAGDVYSRGTAELDKDRNELFSGYNPAKSGSGRFFDGPDVENNEAGEGEDDVERIKQQTRFVKQESVNSTRNALRLAREAEETGRNTLERLGEQAEKLKDTGRHLDAANAHSNRAADNTREIKQLNKSIFRPHLPHWRSNGGNFKEGSEDQADDGVSKPSGRLMSFPGDKPEDGPLVAKKKVQDSSRKRYQFESNASDDDMEEELSNNLDGISEVTERLRDLSSGMRKEIDRQNDVISGIDKKTRELDDKVVVNTERLKRIK